MLSGEHRQTAATEIVTVAGLLLSAAVLSAWVLGYPFWRVLAGLYSARWLCWALTKADRNTFRRSGLLVAFAVGAALVVGSVQSIAALATALLERHEPHQVGAATMVPPAIVAVVGVLLMRWALKCQSRQTEAGS